MQSETDDIAFGIQIRDVRQTLTSQLWTVAAIAITGGQLLIGAQLGWVFCETVLSQLILQILGGIRVFAPLYGIMLVFAGSGYPLSGSSGHRSRLKIIRENAFIKWVLLTPMASFVLWYILVRTPIGGTC